MEAAAQPVGKPMVIRSMNARITLKGTRVTVHSQAKETLVEVAEGSVQVDRPKDGAMVQVRAGVAEEETRVALVSGASEAGPSIPDGQSADRPEQNLSKIPIAWREKV